MWPNDFPNQHWSELIFKTDYLAEFTFVLTGRSVIEETGTPIATSSMGHWSGSKVGPFQPAEECGEFSGLQSLTLKVNQPSCVCGPWWCAALHGKLAEVNGEVFLNSRLTVVTATVDKRSSCAVWAGTAVNTGPRVCDEPEECQACCNSIVLKRLSTTLKVVKHRWKIDLRHIDGNILIVDVARGVDSQANITKCQGARQWQRA